MLLNQMELQKNPVGLYVALCQFNQSKLRGINCDDWPEVLVQVAFEEVEPALNEVFQSVFKSLIRHD